MSTRRLAALAIIAVVLIAPSLAARAAAGSAPERATWLFADLSPAERNALESDLAAVVPVARPLFDRLAPLVAFDSATGLCRGEAWSCSYPNQGFDGRWGIHLDPQTMSGTYPSNRFLVYHEIGHAEWGLLMGDAQHAAFADAMRRALGGRACIDGQDRPCAPIQEVFADEFARYVGGFAVSMSFYETPPLLDTRTFAAVLA
jgi:hypothetical protein